jgi:hypothetical protein
MPFVDFVVVATVAATAAMVVKNRFQSVTYVRSMTDGYPYLVLRRSTREDEQAAADMLAELHARTMKLMHSMPAGDRRTQRLLERYDRSAVSEGGEGFNHTSFSVNKGQRIVLCLREKTDGKLGRLEEINTVNYVVLHELAHLASESFGHKPEFWRNFKFILRVAHRAGLYKKVDYRQKPAQYCGIVIASTSLK